MIMHDNSAGLYHGSTYPRATDSDRLQEMLKDHIRN